MEPMSLKKLLEQYLSLVKKLLPEKEGSFAVGIDIGFHSCKMVEISKAGNAYQLNSFAIEPVVDGNIAQAIKAVLAKAKKPNKSPYTSVFGKGTLIRCLPMPRMTLEDLKKSLAIEADKYFPFAQDQIYTDCFILDSSGEDKRIPVLVAASKKEIIDARVKLLTDLGLHTNFITLNPIAVANVLYVLGSSGAAEKKEPAGQVAPASAASSGVAILDMGETVSNLTILVGRLPRFTRDIFLGGQDLNKRISNALGISLQEAEKLKRQPPKDKLTEILNACDSSLTNLISEMRLSFDYFTTENNLHISKLLLTGGASMLEGMKDYFTKNLDIPAENLNPLSLFQIAEDVSQEELKKNATRLSVAIGLALYHYD